MIYVVLLYHGVADAISCYTCDPALPNRSCLEPTTLTNCDNVDKGAIPPARYDACARLSLEPTSYNASIFWYYYKVERLSTLPSHAMLVYLSFFSL